MTPTLSIITINYNNKDGLKKTIESVVTQTETNFEYIIIDGQSTDGSVDVIKEYIEHPVYGKRITHWVSEPDSGIYNAINKGIKRAQGKYLLFMNSGDSFYNTQVLIRTYHTLQKGEAHVYYGDALYIRDKKFIFYKQHPNLLHKIFFIDDGINHQTAFIQRDLFDDYGLYNENIKIVSDWEKWIEFYNGNCIFKHIELPVVKYDISGISNINRNVYVQERLAVTKKYFLYEDLLQYVSNRLLTTLPHSDDKKIKHIRIFFLNFVLARFNQNQLSFFMHTKKDDKIIFIIDKRKLPKFLLTIIRKFR